MTASTGSLLPLTLTAKSLPAGVGVEASGSEYVMSSVVPSTVRAVAVGVIVSIAMLLLSFSEPVAPGAARVSAALLPAGSAIVPPLRVSAPVPV